MKNQLDTLYSEIEERTDNLKLQISDSYSMKLDINISIILGKKKSRLNELLKIQVRIQQLQLELL